MAKQHLCLAKEIQSRDFGDLFYVCCDEVKDISFIESLYRILNMATENIRKIGSFCEKTAHALLDTIIETALMNVGFSKNYLGIVKT